MNTELIKKITDYVENNIGEFHSARLAKLNSLNLKSLLSSKNPYMFKAKNITTASEMVEGIASSFMASAEETIFGNWLEGLAIFVSKVVYGGYKSSATGIDLEFDKDGVHYLVSIKSGPRWSNSSSLQKLKQDFTKAVRTFNTSRHSVPTKCIEGCCYGKGNRTYNDSTHVKLCGEKFWAEISGDNSLYIDIIEPLGHKAKEKNDAYNQEYSQMINKFTGEFINEYCDANGKIMWDEIVKMNSKS